MANPLFSKFGNFQNGSNFIPGNGRMNGMMGMMQKFQQFRNTFQGDPRQQVQELLNSGQMSKEQFDQLSQIASQFQSMIGK